MRKYFSPQTVFKHAGVPVDFDVHYLSEVSFGQSEPLEDVVAAVRKTGICLKGHFSVPGMDSMISQFTHHWRNIFAHLHTILR